MPNNNLSTRILIGFNAYSHNYYYILRLWQRRTHDHGFLVRWLSTIQVAWKYEITTIIKQLHTHTHYSL